MLAATAQAQYGTSAVDLSFPLRWEEVGGNTNGVLEPGESARLRFDVSMQPAVNTVIPLFGVFSSGTLRGIGGAFLDLWFQNANGGTFQLNGSTGGVPNGLRPEWNVLPGSLGSGYYEPQSSAVRNIQVAQWAQNSLPYDPLLNPTGTRQENPVVDVYTMVWTPQSYLPRAATVSVVIGSTHTPIPSTAVVQTDPDPQLPPTYVQCYGNYTFGSVQIPIVPAPPSAALAAALLISAARRRRVTL